MGKPKLGYCIDELIATIEDFLGWNNTKDAYLVGVGHLGSALLGYQGFKEYGLNIIAAFDIDKDKIGTDDPWRKGIPRRETDNMIKRMGIKIGILTVPAAPAQELTNVMVKAGIEAIWNFSPVKVSCTAGYYRPAREPRVIAGGAFEETGTGKNKLIVGRGE